MNRHNKKKKPPKCASKRGMRGVLSLVDKLQKKDPKAVLMVCSKLHKTKATLKWLSLPNTKQINNSNYEKNYRKDTILFQ